MRSSEAPNGGAAGPQDAFDGLARPHLRPRFHLTLVRQRTQLVTPEACLRHVTIRAHLSEFGIVTPKACLRHVTKGIHSEADQKTAWGAVFPTNDRLLAAAAELPAAARPAVDLLANQLRETQEKIDEGEAG